MFNNGRERITTILADFCVNLSLNIIPNDDIFINYKNIMVDYNLYNDYKNECYTPFIRKIIILLPTLYDKYTTEQITILIDAVLTKIGTLITPINKAFFKSYLLACHTLDTNHLMDMSDKETIIEECKTYGDIINTTFDLEYHVRLLNVYLNNLPNSLDKLSTVSDKIKELKVLRDASPSEFENM